ncbi:MAG: hypothetical protein RIT25_1959 [Planctomycetota bacterium]
MEFLLVEKDPLVRDQVKVGLEQFPDCSVHVGLGYEAIAQLRHRRFDCVFLGVDPREQESMQLLQYLRSFDADTELVVIAPASSIKDMGVQKAKYHIHSFLQSPIDVKEFFGFVGRFRSRKAAAAQQGAPGRRKAPVDPAAVS